MRKIHLFFLSVASGILLGLPWLFPGLSLVLLFAFVPLFFADSFVFQQNRTTGLTFSFLLGFITFFVWNILSTWWIAYVSLAGMLFITSLNALFMATAWWCKNKIHRRLGASSGYFSLIVFWISFEFISHYGMLPWPWLTLGNGFANTVKLIQWYEFTGVLGGSFWVLLSNVLIYITIKNLPDRSFLKITRSAGVALLAIALPVIASWWMYSNYSEHGIIQNVVVLQPNINPYTEKFSGMSATKQVDRLIALADSKITGSTDIVLAPETALAPVWEDSLVLHDASLLPLRQIIQRFPTASFVIGAISRRIFHDDEPISKTAQQYGACYFDRFNSALLFYGIQDIQFSHKNILVAGVEKEPLREYLSFLPDIMLDLGGMNGGLAEGKEPSVLKSFSGQTIGPVICFESAFGGHVRDLVKKGAQYIAVLTNDGWWKDAPGVWQHFGYSRIRAIETRRSVVQSANTGISGFINQRGDILMQTKVNTSVALNSEIRTNNTVTFYVRYGDYLAWICLLLAGFVGIYFFAYRR
jgi:apolipoprotein N-acyltransferase